MKITTSHSLLVGGLLMATGAFAQNATDLPAFTGSLDISNLALQKVENATGELIRGESGITGFVDYGDYEIDSTSGRLFDADVETLIASIGYARAWDEIKFGVFFSYIDSDFESDLTDTNVGTLDTDGDGWFVSFGAATNFLDGALTLTLQGGGGELSFDSDRQSPVGLNVSDYDTTLYYISLHGIYDLYETEEGSIKPFIELGYFGIDSDGFQEVTLAALSDAADIDDFEDEIPYVEVGVDFVYTGLDALTPYLTLSLWQDLGDDEVDIDGLTATDAPLAVDVSDAIETLFTAELGASTELFEDFTLDVSVRYLVADELDGFNVGVAGSYHF